MRLHTTGTAVAMIETLSTQKDSINAHKIVEGALRRMTSECWRHICYRKMASCACALVRRGVSTGATSFFKC